MNRRDTLLIVVYIVIGVATRTFLHIGPNVEFVTGLTLVSAYYLKNKGSIIIPFGIMLVSDWFIGNSAIFLFTWSAYLIGHLAIKQVFRSKKVMELTKRLPRVIKAVFMTEFAGVLFTLFFYIWTNFGVVVVSSIYPKNIYGLFQSYIMGLPFLWPQLIGNLIIVPVISLITYLIFEQNVSFLDKMKVKFHLTKEE